MLQNASQISKMAWLIKLNYIIKHLKAASSLGHSQILSRSHGENFGEGLGLLLCHGLEMVDLNLL